MITTRNYTTNFSRPGPGPAPEPVPVDRGHLPPEKLAELRAKHSGDPQMLKFIDLLAEIF